MREEGGSGETNLIKTKNNSLICTLFLVRKHQEKIAEKKENGKQNQVTTQNVFVFK